MPADPSGRLPAGNLGALRGVGAGMKLPRWVAVAVLAPAAALGVAVLTSTPPAPRDASPAGAASSAAWEELLWRSMATSPLSPRTGAAGVWTGSQLLVWGGGASDFQDAEEGATGYSFNPADGTTVYWVDEAYGDGAAYDPIADRWKLLPPAPVIAGSSLTGGFGLTALWTGTEMLLWGVSAADRRAAAAFAPATGTWRLLPADPLTYGPAHAVWTGNEMIVWGGRYHEPDAETEGAAYSVDTGEWRLIAPYPREAKEFDSVVWTGHEMIVWGGSDAVSGRASREGAAYDPVLDVWRAIAPAPAGSFRHQATWTGEEMLVWGGDGTDARGMAYEPDTDSWRRLPPAPITGRWMHTQVWTGEALWLWGGDEVAVDEQGLADGAAYNPASDTWRPLPAGPLAARCGHAFGWTGTGLLLWGGTDTCTFAPGTADGAALTATGGPGVTALRD